VLLPARAAPHRAEAAEVGDGHLDAVDIEIVDVDDTVVAVRS
jgi:hypothetical protein